MTSIPVKHIKITKDGKVKSAKKHRSASAAIAEKKSKKQKVVRRTA